MKYDAKCSSCEHIFEYERPIKENENPTPPCPSCKSAKTEKVFTLNGGGFILKGDGWYRRGGHK